MQEEVDIELLVLHGYLSLDDDGIVPTDLTSDMMNHIVKNKPQSETELAMYRFCIHNGLISVDQKN